MPEVERIALGPADDAYWLLISSLWAGREDFWIIEQDIEIRGGEREALQSCPEPYCVFAYAGAGWATDQNGSSLWINALGCNRYRAELMVELPNLLNEIGGVDDCIQIPQRHWKRLDARLNSALRTAGYPPHVHEPPVVHHHVYGPGCACGTGCEVPVDTEGRYKP